jgi:hypothetical protein
MKRFKLIRQFIICIFLFFCMFGVIAEEKTLSLDECLKIAFEKNRRIDISKVQVQIAQKSL